jgi:hypothetical protein
MTKITVKDIGAKKLSTKAKVSGPRAKYSTFHITINTNKKPDDDDEADAIGDELRKANKAIFNEDNFPRIVKFLNNDTYDDGLIVSVDVKFSIEVGKSEMGGRVHTHIKAEIKHYSKIHVNLPNLRAIVTEELGYNPYIHVKVVKTSMSLEEYIAKDG